jgi:hypothetical protein
MAAVPHVTSGSGLRKFQAAWFLLNRGYNIVIIQVYAAACTRSDIRYGIYL